MERMRLTNYTNYALRTLMVAALRGPELVRVQDVADAFSISRAHLVKCVHQLGAWGYLENVRGRNGGFRLARPAAEITVGEIVRRTEDGFDLVECFNAATNTCALMNCCQLSTSFRKALQEFLAVLDGITIADIVSNRTDLERTLGLASLSRSAA
jgi:Rrf2 family nitric oxide-sensitive transcriptional repressor